MFSLFARSLLLCVLLQSLATAQSSIEALFENEIRPVLVDTCFQCHGGSKVSGNLRVDSIEALRQGGDSGEAIAIDKPEDSLLLKAIQRHPDVSAMPPDKDKALSAKQIAAFERWIQAGAPWPTSTPKFQTKQHWSFQPIQDPPIPSVKNRQWVTTSVDAFILARQEAAGLTPAASNLVTRNVGEGTADKITLIRRATYDLTGLPPTPIEVDEFLNDASPKAYENLIERLLKSPHYGERWGRHWLDVVRYADTAGETADYPVELAWKYRNYVIDAFNTDKPYDQFVREQIAGDILAQRGPSDRYAEQVTATGYLAISRRFGFDSENYHHLTIQDTIDTVGQSLLGLSLGCARCHDHKFDAISMQDYYGLYGIFDSTRYPFPGSEQKAKMRSLAALIPASQATRDLRQFDHQLAAIIAGLQKQKQPTPTAVLRVLSDIDGDFELQAPAAGGSNGVLVPPWTYQGPVSVTNAAQSPFKNVYPQGKVGASVAAGNAEYEIAQATYTQYPSAQCKQLYLNVDFRLTSLENAKGSHRLWIGSQPDSRQASLLISADGIFAEVDGQSTRIADCVQNQWYNVQLDIDAEQPSQITGRVSYADQAKSFISQSPDTAAEEKKNTPKPAVSYLVIESMNSANSTENYPAIEIDNIALQSEPIASATTESRIHSELASELEQSELAKQLQELVGIGGSFEFQTLDQPPSTPWNPGPNSVVKISSVAQSPFKNTFATGTLGVLMPNRGEYDGFGISLPKAWLRENTKTLYASFDFRNFEDKAGGDGSWRFYLGQGPGNSAAIELYWNAKSFFKRSGDAREPIAPLAVGQWYQVQLKLDLSANSYSGVLTSNDSCVEFTGNVSSGWNGRIDYSFIDSYGHLGGVRPGIYVDNYSIDESPFPSFNSQPAVATEGDLKDKQAKAQAIQSRLALLKLQIAKANEESTTMLTKGPFDLAYAVAEGTPRDAKIQLRGEPSNLGPLVPRGFIQALGGNELDNHSAGSGRLELANWIASPSNPLMARVMINRIWQFHFGRGLVRTPNDFGVRGVNPTHPELLDHLATQFIRNGYSIHSMHRLIMLSSTYRQSELSQTEGLSTSHEDLYVGFSRRRLSAEEIRDSILAVTGELDREPGRGHEFPSWVNGPSYSQHAPFRAVYEHKKRSIYLMTQRIKRHPFLALFDGADPNASTPSRLGTTVPTQALYFLNDPFLHSSSEAWASRLLASASSQKQAITAAYRAAISRSPSKAELTDAEDFLTSYEAEMKSTGHSRADIQSLAAFLRTLISSNEFLHVD